jgi:16S rRNA pseudouridine516 synthase
LAVNKRVDKIPTARLDRLLANLGYGSRRLVQAMVAAGEVTLDRAVLQKADQHIAVSPDLPARMSIDGAPLDPLPPLTLIMHKPLGVVCSHRELGQSIYELLPVRWTRRDPVLSTVGRLDKETSGLLLLTDDGGLLHRIISPKAEIAKRYHVTLDRPLEGHEAALFAGGAMLLPDDDKPLQPAILEQLTANVCWLTITEGRYHQVRRMFESVGNRVSALHRDRIGGLDLPRDLTPGAYRPLSGDELRAVIGSS